MPKRKPRSISVRSTNRNQVDGTINFTFFNSKMFLTLVAIALLVIVFAIFSSVSGTSDKQTNLNGENYRINTSTIKNDPSAQNVLAK